MNILLIHNRYKQAGGEDVVVTQESRLLEREDHTVMTYTRSNYELDSLSFVHKMGLMSRVISAKDSKSAVWRLIGKCKPDVVHVHNTFFMVSPSVYEACQENNIPVVQTLHNYRLLCPAATFYRNGGVCEECVTHGLLRSVQHECYRDSRAVSAAIAIMLTTHRSRQTWSKGIDAYIAISRFVRNKFVESGFPAAKIFVKPNFVDPDPGERSCPGSDYALFVGRLSPEKGLSTLLEAWRKLPIAVPLLIVGDGPLRGQLAADIARGCLNNIRFAGPLSRSEVYKAMKKAAFLVVPSVWQEAFGLIVAEAFACGTPVLGSRIGGIPEMLEDEATGLHFTPGDSDDLAKKVAWAWKHGPELAAMGKAARRVYEAKYTARTNYGSLMRIYASARNNLDEERTVGAA
jgi:glycosyltransferase involved in cell wall biosynthesis